MADASDGDSTFDVEAGAGAGRETGTETRAGETETARPPPPATPPLANAGAAQDIAISIAMEKVVFFMVFLSSTIAHSTPGYGLLLLRVVGCYRVGTLDQFKVIFTTNAQTVVDVFLELLAYGNRNLFLELDCDFIISRCHCYSLLQTLLCGIRVVTQLQVGNMWLTIF